MGQGKKGVFYGVDRYVYSLNKQVESANALMLKYNSKIIKHYIDNKTNLVLENLIDTRKELLNLMRWTVRNKSDFIICFDEACLFDNKAGKEKIKKFIAANRIPIILCDRELLFHPLITV